MTSVVLGGTGLIGRHVIAAQQAKGGALDRGDGPPASAVRER
jgi:uncharacterized protein YbjT (DUF2867 family)